VELSETVYGSEALREALLYSEIDLAISQGFAVGALKDVSTARLRPLGTYLVISAKHPLARSEELPIEGLAAETFYTVQYDSAADMESITRRACAALGFEPKAVKAVPNMASLIRAVSSGKGAALCGRIDRISADGQLRHYTLPKYPGFREHSIVAAWRTGQLSREAGELLDLLRELKAP
jgi:DNA-binding transcriptional LysR family regulator